MNDADILLRYCDLTYANYKALAAAGNAHRAKIHPGMRNSMANMIDENNKITNYGKEMLERIDLLLDPEKKAMPENKEPFEPGILPASLARRIQKLMTLGIISPPWKVASVHVKLLTALYNHPGMAYRFLCSVYGRSALSRLLNADWITGVEYRGYPFYVTDKGIDVIHALRKEFKK
ncbi:MAG: hypothetical protein JW908_00465 [Anaerolineales bacterium]|nr:hypothetical protein [Anaerolineales bacterium]